MTSARLAPAEPRQAGREVELSLVITAADPERVFRRIAKLRAVGGYLIRPRKVQKIVDCYFDTPDRELRKREVALRVRTVGGKTLIAVKGRRRVASTNTEDRSEWEREFSRDAVEEIAKRLGLRTSSLAADRGDDQPASMLAHVLGVGLVQRRETTRLPRDVRDARDGDGIVLAELALDRVRFHINEARVRHHEIEVEAKRTGRGTEAAKAIAAELRSRYHGELAEWPYGKFPTGLAVERLFTEGRLDVANGDLTPAAYEQIRDYLKRR